MSSLAAARADNFYIHPEWRPEYGGISKFAGSTGANQYQKYGIIRFELPFDGWCTKCERHIGKGTRFNAKKDKDGKYFTTQIYSFSMKCASCDNELIIKTDPQNNTYDYAQGIRKMEQDYEMNQELDSIVTPLTDEARELIASDPIYRLQHEKEDLEKSQSSKEQIVRLLDHNEETRKNDFDANSRLRQMNRTHRKRARELQAEGEKRGLSVPLVEPNESDEREAVEAMRRSRAKRSRQRNTEFDIAERKAMTTIQTSSIFSTTSSKKTQTQAGAKPPHKGKQQQRLSSHARDHLVLQEALQKQAERNINVRKFSLLSSSQRETALPPCSVKKRDPTDPAHVSGSGSLGGLLEGYGSD
jgi:coiled-coil domain-containing protein 130